MSVLRFIGWGLVGLIVGYVIGMVVEIVLATAISFTMGSATWWQLHTSPAWGLVVIACWLSGIWLMWSRMTGALKRKAEAAVKD